MLSCLILCNCLHIVGCDARSYHNFVSILCHVFLSDSYSIIGRLSPFSSIFLSGFILMIRVLLKPQNFFPLHFVIHPLAFFVFDQ